MTDNAFLADRLGSWLKVDGMTIFAETFFSVTLIVIVAIIATYFLTRSV